MAVIEGTFGDPLRKASGAPGAGTNEVQTVSINASGGTFALAFDGYVTPDITWSATNATLLARVNAAIQGSAEVQTITFPATPSGTFRLRFRNQETAAITWSATNNTLVSNIDTALEALAGIGSAGVVTAAGTMTSGVGTITFTFADYGPQDLISVVDNRTGVVITVARTTPGTIFPPGGKSGIVASDSNLSSGVGDFLLTFSGANVARKAQNLITVADNSLTGTATVSVAETTPGVDADFRGAAIGAIATDAANGKQYSNTGTAALPTWTVIGSQS